MFQKEEFKRLLPLIFFFVGYSLLFFLGVKAFFYLLPFVLGFFASLLVQPAIHFLDEKLHWNHSFSSAAAVIFVLGALTSAVILLGVFLFQEAAALAAKIASGDFPELSPPVNRLLEKARAFLEQFDSGFLERNRQEILEWVKSSTGMLLSTLKTLFAIVSTIPAAVTLFFVMAASSFFMARDMDKLKAFGKRLLGEKLTSHIKKAIKGSRGTGKKCVASYLLIYFITFCETVIVFSILNIPYPFLSGFAAAVADILPVLGPGFALIPLAVYQGLTAQYAKALGILIGWLLITGIRQIIEPKLIASTAKIHPLVMLAAVYFSLVSGSFWVFFYILGLFTLYGAFQRTGALPALVFNEKEKTRKSG